MKQSRNERRSCLLCKEFARMLSVRIAVKIPPDCEVGVAEELAQSPPEYQVDDDKTYYFSKTSEKGKH